MKRIYFANKISGQIGGQIGGQKESNKIMRIIKVEWIDSCASNHNWLMKADIDNWDDVEPLSIFTYGALVQEDENYIVVAQNYGFDPEQCCNLMSIPKGCIKEIKTIEELKPTKK